MKKKEKEEEKKKNIKKDNKTEKKENITNILKNNTFIFIRMFLILHTKCEKFH